jgi:DNA-binding transcriptional MocR family regulator
MTPEPDIGGILGSWAAGDRPLYEQLADALRSAIVDRDLPPGSRLPAERELARMLAISRTTVAGAYEALKADGWLESRQGSGTRVRAVLGESGERMIGGGGVPRLAPFWGPGADPEVINLTRSSFRGFEDFPLGAAALPEVDLAALIDGSVGYDASGLPELRSEIAAWMSANRLPTSAEEIVITTGAQQAISLLAALYLKPGAPVVLQNPTFYGAIDVFRGADARLLPIHVGHDGLDPDELEGVLRQRSPALTYLTLSFHNPTGVVASMGVRRRLAGIVEASGIPLIDDLELAWHVIDGTPPAPLGALTTHEGVISVASMSKMFWAGLRVGWVRAAPAILARIARLKMVADLGSSLPSQLIAVQMLRHGPAIVARRRQQLAVRRAALQEAVARHLPEWDYVPPKGGVYLWLRLPQGDAFELAQVAARHGVVITPGNGMSVDGSFPDYVRIPFVEPPEVIYEGIARLGRAWRLYRSATDLPVGTATTRPVRRGSGHVTEVPFRAALPRA